MISNYAPIKFENDKLYLLDQRALPQEEVFLEYTDLEGGYHGIQDMVVRGAPCIGFTGIYSIALWLKANSFDKKNFKKACDYLKTSRPTAVNLAFEVDRAYDIAINAHNEGRDPYLEVVKFGNEQIIHSEKNNRAMAHAAANELNKIYGNKKLKIQTHCNTGFLACGSIGTALGVVQYLNEINRLESVWVDETRPYLQGSRLTAYELKKLNIDYKIVAEGASAFLMGNNLVDAIFVGADRIAANGDTANKIGTASLSIVAKFYKIPFYVVAPLSTFDIDTKTGTEIEIEMRNPDEILKYKNLTIAPKDAKALNPSFDVTLAENITGIICEKGLIRPNYNENISRIFDEI